MIRSFSIALALVVALGTRVTSGDDGVPTADYKELHIDLQNLVRITPSPIRMQPDSRTACLPSPPPKKSPNGHGILVRKQDAVIHVYVSADGVDAMKRHDATPFPVGAVVLKEKFAESSAQNVVFYTGMVKHAKGYNPQCGDWEFFTMSNDRKTISARGRIDSCMACHQKYSGTDFVTKKYPIER